MARNDISLKDGPFAFFFFFLLKYIRIYITNMHLPGTIYWFVNEPIVFEVIHLKNFIIRKHSVRA